MMFELLSLPPVPASGAPRTSNASGQGYSCQLLEARQRRFVLSQCPPVLDVEVEQVQERSEQSFEIFAAGLLRRQPGVISCRGLRDQPLAVNLQQLGRCIGCHKL